MENVTLLLSVGCWRLVAVFGKKKWGLRGAWGPEGGMALYQLVVDKGQGRAV